MKLKKQMKKISFSIPLKVIGAISLVMIIICVIVSVMLTKLTTGLVQEQIGMLATENAKTAEKYLDAMQTRSKSLAEEFARYKTLDPETAESLMKKSLYTVLDDPRIFSSYVALEPDAFFADTPDGLSFYAYRDGDSVGWDVLNDYADYSVGDYYLPTKQTLKGHLTEPYSYTLSNGETVWLITISNPILSATGKFLGVTNCDIIVDVLNEQDFNLGGYSSAYSFILTNNANYVTHTADKSLFGTAFDQTDAKAANAVKTGQTLQQSGTNDIFSGADFESFIPLNI